MRAGIYARISEDRDETQLGVQRQVQDCETLAKARQWRIVDRYIDNDTSAYKRVRRPEYRRMLTDIASRRIDAVIVYHQDRLHRQPRELEEFFDICDRAGLTSLASVSGDVDLSTHDGRFTARIMGAVARKASDDQSRRLQRKALEIAQRGKPAGGGHRPFGFETDRVTINPDEAKIVREIAERFLAGETLRALCVDLNRRGLTTTAGGRWVPVVLRRLLRSARLSGQREHRGEIISQAVWPSIITPEQTARIRALLARQAERPSRAPRSYLLTGLLRCGECGAQLVARPRGDGTRRYVCARGPQFTGCGKIATVAEPLEALVSEAVIWAMDSPRLADAVGGRKHTSAGDWQQRADVATFKLDELAGLYGTGAISAREWVRAREPWQAQLKAGLEGVAREAGIPVLADYAGRPGVLRDRWPELTFEQRHAIIGAALTHVIVRAGRRGYNRFDPGRFELVWRH